MASRVGKTTKTVDTAKEVKVVEEKKAVVEEVKTPEVKAAPVEEKKASVEEKKAPVEEKAAPAKRGRKPGTTTKAKTATTKTTVAKTVAPKAPEANVVLQFTFGEYITDEIVEKCKKAYEAENTAKIKSIDVYVKPSDKKAYYVVNDKVAGSVEL
ncbi:MAG: DUF6465 family protein [Lachnospiraceae bacterium]|nr:DUF6465 family protein [Lachnospiraceae bacterium]